MGSDALSKDGCNCFARGAPRSKEVDDDYVIVFERLFKLVRSVLRHVSFHFWASLSRCGSGRRAGRKGLADWNGARSRGRHIIRPLSKGQSSTHDRTLWTPILTDVGCERISRLSLKLFCTGGLVWCGGDSACDDVKAMHRCRLKKQGQVGVPSYLHQEETLY